MNFVTEFLEFTKEYESPTSFWRWAAYSVIAATLRKNVYLPQGFRKLYPNIYVVLLADSAQYRKSGPFGPVAELMNKIHHTKIIQGRASVQGILDELSLDTVVGGAKITGGSCLLLAEELAGFFVSDPQLIPMVTDIYDPRDVFPYTLRSSKITIKDTCVTLLAASNETFLREVYTNRAVYGGLLGRTFMVKPDELRPPNSLWNMGIKDYSGLADTLHKIKNLKGAVTATQDAINYFDIWYVNLYNNYSKLADRTGVTQRMHSNVLKLSIILAASHGSLEINELHIKEAIDRVTELKSNYEVYAMSSGTGNQAESGAIVLNALWEAPANKLHRADILRLHWHQISAEELDKLMETLSQAKLVEIAASNGGIWYTMTEKCKAIFQKRMAQ